MGSDRPRLVVNCSPLIALARIERLDLLDRLAEEVVVPEGVVVELRRGPEEDPSRSACEQLERARVAKVEALDPAVEAWDLGRGECEVLTLARRLGAMAVLDDREARRCATALAIPRIGTLGLLLVAKKSGYVVSVKPLIEELIRARIFLGIALVKRALLEAGEQ